MSSSSPDWPDMLMSVLSPLDISYDSELFVVHPDGNDDDVLNLWEVYGGVGPAGQDFVVDHFASWKKVDDDGEKALEVMREGNIWHRRADLRGRMFK